MPIFIGTIIGMIIGFGISGTAIWYFWRKGKSAPKDVLQEFASRAGLTYHGRMDDRSVASGMFRNLRTEITVVIDDPPRLESKIRLPQALPIKLVLETHPYERGATFRSCYKLTCDDEAQAMEILTESVQRALTDLASAADTVFMNDDEIRWTGPGTITDVKKLPAMQARVQGIVMALGQA